MDLFAARQRKRTMCYEDDSSDSTCSGGTSPDAFCMDICVPSAAVVVSAMAAVTESNCASPASSSSCITVSTFSHCSQADAAQKRAMLERFAQQALVSYMTADPCADHHLKLLQFNTINGFTKNAGALGYQFDWLVCAAVSPFGCNGPGRSAVGPAAAAVVPSSLKPTTMQLTTRHHPWLDLFPFPRMRDNLLIAAGVLSPEEEQQLFTDVMESDGGKDEWTGLVLWGEPWDLQSWEVSLPFLKRWAWLVNGCPEIITSTNHWRRKRGEDAISAPGFVLDEY